jgi:hypothetical protein
LRMDDCMQQPRLERRFSVCDPVNLGGRPSDFDGNLRWTGSPDYENNDEELTIGAQFSPFPYIYNMPGPTDGNDEQSNNSRYCVWCHKHRKNVTCFFLILIPMVLHYCVINSLNINGGPSGIVW